MKSHINVAKFTKRIPTEQYAYEEYSLEAAIDASESGEDVLIEMRRQVSSAFAADLVESTEQKDELKAAKKAAKKEKKNGKSKTRPANDEDENGEDPAEIESGDGEGTEDDETGTDSADDDDNSESEDDEASDDAGEDQGEESEESEDDGEDDSDKKPGKKGKPAADKKGGKKTFKKKPQSYNRGIDQHREIFSRVLRSVKPDWKESEKMKVRAKKISEQLEGENFLDENGEVLSDFKAEVKKRLLAK